MKPIETLNQPTVGMRYRVRKSLREHFTTPPPVGTLCTVWSIEDGRINLSGVPADTGATLMFPVSEAVLRDFFEEC